MDMKDYTSFIQRKFAEKSDIDVRSGSMVMDVAIKPLGIFSKDSSDELERLRFTNNIANYANMTSDELDVFAAKFFAYRAIGGRVYGVATIFFTKPTGFTILASSAIFSGSEGQQFKPVNNVTVTAQAISTQRNSNGLYYWDVNIVSLNNIGSLEIPVGSIVSLTGVQFEFASVKNNAPMSAASKDETNEEFFTRLQQAVNDRSFYSRRSIYGRLSENFPFIRSAEIVGAGDPRMERDLVQAIDPNEPQRNATYFGKYPAAEFIPHIAYWNTFPLEATDKSATTAHLSPITKMSIPNSILPREDAIDATADPAQKGFSLTNEFTHEMYKGLYRRETRAFTRVETSILYSIFTAPSFGGDQPDLSWSVGIDGVVSGNYGTTSKNKKDYFEATSDRNFIFRSAGLPAGFTAQKNVGKRVGVLATGEFTIPGKIATTETNPLMFFLLAGADNTLVEGALSSFSGIGFAVRKGFSDDGSPSGYKNVFIVNNNKDSTLDFYANGDDLSGEVGWALESFEWSGLFDTGDNRDIVCNFEIAILDDLTIALNLWKEDTTQANSSMSMKSTKLLAVKDVVMSSEPNGKMYGQNFKITMEFLPDTPTGEETPLEWRVGSLQIADTSSKKPMALFQIDVSSFGNIADIELSVRASSVNDRQQVVRGFDVYLWDVEANDFPENSDPRISGAWQKVAELSLSDTSSDEFNNLKTTIQNLDRFIYKTDIQKIVYILVTPSGKSLVFSRYSTMNPTQITQAQVDIDFIRMFDQSYGMYHAKNKSDVYVTTIRNNDSNIVLTELFETDSLGIISLRNAKKPILSIDSVTTEDGTIVLGTDEYTVVVENDAYRYSAKESISIVAPNYIGQILQVTYTYYSNVKVVQDFFDSEDNQGNVGDVLMKHRSPFFLDFTINYTGDVDANTLKILVNDWFDDNVKYDLEVYDLISFLKTVGVSDIKLPLTISYETDDPNGRKEAGTFQNRISIDSLKFFRLRNTVYNRG